MNESKKAMLVFMLIVLGLFIVPEAIDKAVVAYLGD